MILRESARFRQSPISEIKPNVAVLTSWKDIAQYIGKGVRTVQRWEKDLGLPVRRPKHARKSTVLAVPAEINAWVRSQQLADGQVDVADADREELLRYIHTLQAENAELRSQLQLENAKTA